MRLLPHRIPVLVDKVTKVDFRCATRVEHDYDKPLMDFMKTTITPQNGDYAETAITCWIETGEVETIPLVIKHFIEGQYAQITEQKHLFECLEDANGQE